jgi:hypothetical protein
MMLVGRIVRIELAVFMRGTETVAVDPAGTDPAQATTPVTNPSRIANRGNLLQRTPETSSICPRLYISTMGGKPEQKKGCQIRKHAL